MRERTSGLRPSRSAEVRWRRASRTAAANSSSSRLRLVSDAAGGEGAVLASRRSPTRPRLLGRSAARADPIGPARSRSATRRARCQARDGARRGMTPGPAQRRSCPSAGALSRPMRTAGRTPPSGSSSRLRRRRRPRAGRSGAPAPLGGGRGPVRARTAASAAGQPGTGEGRGVDDRPERKRRSSRESRAWAGSSSLSDGGLTASCSVSDDRRVAATNNPPTIPHNRTPCSTVQVPLAWP